MCASGVYAFGVRLPRVRAAAAAAVRYNFGVFFMQDLTHFSSKSESKRHLPMVYTLAATRPRRNIGVWHLSLHVVSGSTGPFRGRADVGSLVC